MTDHVRTCRISIRRWLAAAVVGLLSLNAWASFPASGGNTIWRFTETAYSTSGYSTAQAACDYISSRDLSGGTWSASFGYNVNATTQQWWCNKDSSQISAYAEAIGTAPLSCPANATLSGTTCTCNAGSTQNGTSCTSMTGADWARLLNESGAPLVGDGACTITSCYQGHTLRGSGGTCWKDKTTGVNSYEIYGPYTATGQSCSMTPTTGGGSPVAEPATPSPATCTGYWGSVNGVDKCIPKTGGSGTGTVSPENKDTTTTDGTGTTTTSTDGVTSCFDGTCSTTKTTTTTPPGGGTPVTTTTTSTQPKVTYCQENPNAPACKAPSECETSPDSLACLKLGTPDNGVQLPKLDAGFSAITPVSFAAGVGCPADLTFNVNAKPYAISYAPMCTAASTYGAPVVLILGVALAAFIFIGGFKA